MLVSEVKERDGIEPFWCALFSPVLSLGLPCKGMLRDDVMKETTVELLVPKEVVVVADWKVLFIPCDM
jgi:hypothetical protein